MLKANFIFLFFLLTLNCFSQTTITSISPSVGYAGQNVLISGSNFSTINNNNIVYFGGAKATVLFSQTNLLNVTIPTGCTYDPITVTTNGSTAYSNTSFKLLSGNGLDINDSAFKQKVNFTTDLHPNSISLADLDGDGKLDIATANNYSTTGSPASISVLRNISTSNILNFSPRQDINNGPVTYAITNGDIDGDGKLDLIASSVGEQNISIFRNTSTVGNILFATKIDIPSGTNPYSIGIRDLDKDGKPEVVVLNSISGIISIYKNGSTIGNISFSPKVDFQTLIGPERLAIGDIDGDTKMDIVVTNKLSNSFSVFPNTSTVGNISLNTRVDISCGTNNKPTGITLGDFDNDNKLDIAMVVTESITGASSAQIYKNQSTVSSINLSLINTLAAGVNTAYAIATNDFNGDEKLDLALSVTGGGLTKIFQNTSISNGFIFTEKTSLQSFSPYALAIGDFNGDSKPDIVTSNFVSNNISILQSKCGSPLILNVTPMVAGVGQTITIIGSNFNQATSVTVGGVNVASFMVLDNNTITAVLGSGASGAIVVTNSEGTASLAGFIYSISPIVNSIIPAVGSTGSTVTISGANFIGATSITFGGVAAASFVVNSNSSITAILGNGGSGNVVITTSNGTATIPNFLFTNIPLIASFSPSTGNIGSVVTINGYNFSSVASNNIVYFGDIKATVISATPNAISVAVPAGANYKPISVTVLGKTTFSKLPFVVTISAPATITNAAFANKSDFLLGNQEAYGVGTADLNLDGKSDLLAANFSNLKNCIFQNTSASNLISFNARIDSSSEGNPIAIDGYDFDGDGKKDLISSGNQQFVVQKNNSTTGNLLLSPKQFFGVTGPLDVISVSDYTLDGKPDVAFSNNIGYVLRVFNNTSSSNINFDLSSDFVSGKNYGIANGDFDNDGKNDIVVANIIGTTSSGEIAIYKNTSNPTTLSFGTPITFPTAVDPYSITTTDLDGDGKLDIIVANNGSNSISVFKNNSSNGNISFANKIDFVAGFGPRYVCAGDLNGDGKVDIVVVNSLSNSISIFQNSSTSTNIFFLPKVDVITSTFPQKASLADFDNDGLLDIAVCTYGLGAVTIHRNALITPTIIPTITSFTPTSAASGTVVTITGTNFTGATAVSFGGVNATSFTIVNATTITATVGVGGATGSVNVTTPIGTATLNGFTYSPTLPLIPTITSFSPTSAVSGTVVTITGTNFTGATAASFGGVNATSFTIVNATIITATVGASGATGAVSIITPTGTATLNGFIYLPTLPLIPTITSFTPTSAVSGTLVTITGTNFTGATAVSFGGVNATSFTIVNATTITATVSAGGATGSVNVTTPIGTATLNGFTYSPTLPLIPTITSFSPTSAVSGTVVTISGTNFTGATAVSFGGVNATSFTIVNATTITATVGASGATGAVNIITPTGTATLNGFTYLPTLPLITTITLFTPTSAVSGTVVTISGTNFTGATAVSFGGVNATSFTIVNATTINAIVSAGGASGAVKVTTSLGNASKNGFTFLLIPQITNVGPLTAIAGSTVIINGHNFVGITSVTFGGTNAASFTVLNDSTISAVLGTGSQGDIIVTNNVGSAVFTSFIFGRTIPVDSISVYPSPANNFIILVHPISNKSYIDILTYDGKLLTRINCKPGTFQTRINTSLYLSGYYTLKWTDRTQLFSKPLMIIH